MLKNVTLCNNYTAHTNGILKDAWSQITTQQNRIPFGRNRYTNTHTHTGIDDDTTTM